MVTERDAWLVLIYSLGLFFGVLIWVACLTVFLSATGTDIWSAFGMDKFLMLNALLTMVALLTPVLAQGLLRGWAWRQALRWRPLSFWVVFQVTLATLALNLSVSQGFLWLLSMPFFEWAQQSGYGELLEKIAHHKEMPLLVIIAVMVQALPEELTFRGVIQQGFERRYAPTIAITLTSLFFALFHLNPLQALIVLPTSLFWGWVAFRTQSIIPTVVAHACQNGLTALALAMPSLAGQGSGSPLGTIAQLVCGGRWVAPLGWIDLALGATSSHPQGRWCSWRKGKGHRHPPSNWGCRRERWRRKP
jgi:membrane protease YdiL (CAAX protease family)